MCAALDPVGSKRVDSGGKQPVVAHQFPVTIGGDEVAISTIQRVALAMSRRSM